MAIQATFTADTRPLEQGLERAVQKIAGVKTRTDETARSLKSMGSSFDGTKTEGTALRIAASVQKIGGAVRLTDTEWKRADRTVSEVLQKYERFGATAPAAIQALRRELDSVRASATQASGALGSLAGGAGRGFGAIASGLGIGIGAGLGLGAITAAAATLKDLAGDAARLTPLQQSFERLQGGAVQAERQILALRTATKGLVSDADLLQAANKGSLLGLDAMGIRFEEVASIATTLGRAMGQDAAKSVDDLTTALSRMSPQILDNLGIKVDLTQATEAYAASLGTSADALTEEERKRAFANAAMDAAREKVKTLGEVTLTVAEQSSRIAVAFGDIATQAISAGNQSVTLAGQLGLVADMLAKIRGAGVGTSFRVLASEVAGSVQNAVRPFLSPFNLGGALLYGGAGMVRDASGVTQGDLLSVITGKPQRTGRMGVSSTRAAGSQIAAQATAAATAAERATRAVRSLKTEADKPIAPSSFLKQIGVNQNLTGTFGTTGIAGAIIPNLNPFPGDTSPGAFDTFAAGRSRGIAGITVDLQAGIPALRNWRTEVRGLAQAFGTLAQVAGPSMDNVTRGIGTVLAASDAANQLVTSLSAQFGQLGDGKGGLSTGGKAVAGGLAGLTTGLSLGSLFTNRAGGALAGAAGGAASGAMAGGPWGALAGGIVGAASGLFAANQNRKAQAAQIEQMRQQTIASFGTYAQFQTVVERAGYSMDYFLRSFNSNNPKEFTRVLNELNRVIAEQKARADAMVKSLQGVAQVQGVLTQQQIAQIRNLRAGDPGADDVVAFAQGQREQAERGILAVVAALETRGADAVAEFGVATDAAAAGLAALFGEALSNGESAISVLGRLGGAMNTLADLFSKAGKTPGAGFAAVQDLASIIANPQAGAAVQTATGLGQALAGFYNTGVFAALPDLFGDIANGIGAAWKALENFGAGGQRGAALLQPYLQNLWEIIEANPQLEEQLDEQTRSLLEFARANGIVGPQFKDAAEKMQLALERLIEKLDEFISRMATASGLAFPNPNVPTSPTPAEGTPGGGNGGSGGDYGAGSGAVQPGTLSVSSVAPSAGVAQVINVQVGREVIARAAVEGLPRLVEIYGVGA